MCRFFSLSMFVIVCFYTRHVCIYINMCIFLSLKARWVVLLGGQKGLVICPSEWASYRYTIKCSSMFTGGTNCCFPPARYYGRYFTPRRQCGRTIRGTHNVWFFYHYIHVINGILPHPLFLHEDAPLFRTSKYGSVCMWGKVQIRPSCKHWTALDCIYQSRKWLWFIEIETK